MTPPLQILTVLIVTAAWGQQKPSTDAGQKATGFPGVAIVNSVMNEERGAREADLRKLAASQDEGVAMTAVVSLIRLRTPNVTQLVVETIPRLSDFNLLPLLGVVGQSRDLGLRAGVARACLRQVLGTPASPKETQRQPKMQGAAGIAAMLLSGSTNPIDRNLIEDALKVRPAEGGLWLAISKLGIPTQADLALARSVYQTEHGQSQLAAAAALAPGDPKARDFVVQEITAFLTEFGQIDVQTLVLQAYAQTSPSGRERIQLASFQTQLWMLVTLQFIQIPEAERITFEFIDSPNKWVRATLGLIAAQRWPQRLAKTAISRNSERFDLLTTAAVMHPEILPLVRSLIPTEELNKRLAKLSDSPLDILLPSAPFFHLIL